MSHAKEKHHLSPGAVTREHFEAELSTLSLAQHAKDMPLPSPFGPPVEVLEVLLGYRCTMEGCYHCCPLPDSITRHQRLAHPGPSQRDRVAKASIQRVINSAVIYFPVNPTLALPSTPAFEKLMEDIIPNLPKPPSAQPTTFRDITPFHSAMGWWEHLEKFKVKDQATRSNIIELVSTPKPSEKTVFLVVRLVQDYFEAATKFVNEVGFSIRQAIMDQYVTALTSCHRSFLTLLLRDGEYWRELQSDSSRKYTNEVIQAVSACIRFVSGSHVIYKLAMTPTRIRESSLLLEALQEKGDAADFNRSSAFHHLHLLIQSFWEENPNEGPSGELDIFWFSYLCASSVRPDGDLSDAGNFASSVSTLKYSLRIFMVNDIPQEVTNLADILK